MISLKGISEPREAMILRIGLGGALGLVIAALVKAAEAHSEGSLIPSLAGALGLSLFLLWAGAGVMRRLTLMIWSGVSAIIIGLILNYNFQVDGDFGPSVLPVLSFPLILFIAHELVSSADISGRPIAPYATYFDEAWKRGMQLIAALAFAGLFWLIVLLGALLLGLIGLDWLQSLLTNVWFLVPANAMALGAGFHLADVSTRLLAQFRTFVLGVLGWLLPVMVVIGVLFVAGLAIKGLEPLWGTKAATMTLVSACVMLVLLINAAYQQGEGDDERRISPILKIAVRAACALLIIFAALAAYSLWLRINQHGLTPTRVMAAVAVLFSVLYAGGYAASALMIKGRWMAWLEKVNIALAFFMVTVFISLLTPLADPRRLSVDNQVARLTSGKIDTAHFGWSLLAMSTGVYGRNALVTLSKSGDATLSTRASDVLKYGASKYEVLPQDELPDLTKLRIVHSAVTTLPEGWPDASLRHISASECLSDDDHLSHCFAIIRDLDGNGVEEVILVYDPEAPDEYGNVLITSKTAYGTQKAEMSINRDAIAELRAGKITVTPRTVYDLSAGNEKIGTLYPNGD